MSRDNKRISKLYCLNVMSTDVVVNFPTAFTWKPQQELIPIYCLTPINCAFITINMYFIRWTGPKGVMDTILKDISFLSFVSTLYTCNVIHCSIFFNYFQKNIYITSFETYPLKKTSFSTTLNGVKLVFLSGISFVANFMWNLLWIIFLKLLQNLLQVSKKI